MNTQSVIVLLMLGVALSLADVSVPVGNTSLPEGNTTLLAVSKLDENKSPVTNLTGRSMPGGLLSKGITLPFSIRAIGMIECNGFDHTVGGHFFETILGEAGADFGGNYLCGPTCGGQCVPNQDIGVAPVSLYAFGCRCPAPRCSAEGPLITTIARGIFKVVCVRDTTCSCQGMGKDHHVGYLCNWININTGRFVTFLDRRPNLPPAYSPIRWCSCCPQPFVGP